VKPLPLRTSLTIVYTGILAVLMTALAITTHTLFVRQLDDAATANLEEKARGLHGYLQFKDGLPVLEYSREDVDSAAFVDDATDYYQVFDARDGRLLTQSSGLEALGLNYTPEEVAELRANAGTHDIQTDRGRLRPHSVGHPPVRDPGGPAVVRVLGEVAPVHSEQIGDPAQRALDLSIDVRGRDTAEGRNLLRQQGLELESLAEEHLGAAPSGPLEQEPDGEQERAEHESRAHGDLPDDPLTRHFLKL